VRIVAGSHKGARIFAPPGQDTRPTGDRVREAAFNLIGPVEGASVLDLFAGSGAMGLEALSRGAERAVFVESDREACRAIDRNLAKLGLTGARIACGDVLRFLASERSCYDLVLVDPPYEMVESLHMRLGPYLRAVLAENGLLVFETAAKTELDLPLRRLTSRRYGSARLTLFEHDSLSSGAAGKGGEPEARRTVETSTAKRRWRSILPPAAPRGGEAGLGPADADAGEGRE
jgi:16S rRNA (guanine966-N2)-methyltransferase